MEDDETDRDGVTSPGRPGVLFDIDGTLLDSSYLHALTWWRALHDHGHDRVTMSQAHAAVGLAGPALVEHLLGEGDDEVVKSQLQHLGAVRHLVTALPGAADLLRACASRGAAVVLITNGGSEDLEWMLPLLGEGDGGGSVAGVVTSEDAGAPKPAPDPLSTAVERHGLDPRRTVVVGDAVWDARAAARAGLPCVALRCGGIGEGDLRAAGAVSVRDHPADLLEHLEDLDRALVA